ncbi:PAAR domain-containing protein [Xenorhabdus szentirmaii]|uniref:PAAR motif-containing protein n=1 Tax=Xenorhabdus szentirmaii TaxID=290112 RepID=A0AAW3YZX6_9GAMM|nr:MULTISPECIES: hypothetical protein [unclassified Xenorhabdus]MBD2780571.1 hypothetical protein [Xenorhabdus sp. 38]MBD2801813.1 hypothetical protein [Xenorhabdus sp. M]
MGNAVKMGDIGTNHGNCPATPIISGATSAKADGAYFARTGDAVDCSGVVIGGGSVNIG